MRMAMGTARQEKSDSVPDRTVNEQRPTGRHREKSGKLSKAATSLGHMHRLTGQMQETSFAKDGNPNQLKQHAGNLTHKELERKRRLAVKTARPRDHEYEEQDRRPSISPPRPASDQENTPGEDQEHGGTFADEGGDHRRSPGQEESQYEEEGTRKGSTAHGQWTLVLAFVE